MKSPYDTLGIANAEPENDESIKLAYLQKVKENPPDHDPDAFQRIHEAYACIKDRKSRAQHALFQKPEADFSALLDQALQHRNHPQFDAEQFESLLRLSLNGTPILHFLPQSDLT